MWIRIRICCLGCLLLPGLKDSDITYKLTLYSEIHKCSEKISVSKLIGITGNNLRSVARTSQLGLQVSQIPANKLQSLFELDCCANTREDSINQQANQRDSLIEGCLLGARRNLTVNPPGQDIGHLVIILVLAENLVIHAKIFGDLFILQVSTVKVATGHLPQALIGLEHAG